MSKYQPEWIFNLTLQLAVAFCLSMLVLALAMDTPPLTALWRSALVFIVFVLLGWATSFVWQVPEPSEVPIETEDEAADRTEQALAES